MRASSSGSENAGGGDGLGVGFRGGDLVGEETDVEGEGTLPGFEGGVEGLAEAAGPHFGWVLIMAESVLRFMGYASQAAKVA